MRYLGNKTKLLFFINSIIEKYEIEGEVFADIFAGTGSVGDEMKGRFRIISNDYLYFSTVLNKAKLLNNCIPRFEKFCLEYNVSPFEWLNSREYNPKSNYFIYHNYSLKGNRMYLTEENAISIDGMRIDIEELYREQLISENEYFYLLASLIESITKVSNTSGTYQAFFKFWESRSLKKFVIEPLSMNEVDRIDENNKIYNRNANELARKIEGDIVYIDPPYTSTQYINSYHLLETVAKYDNPEIFGKTGRRKKREVSNYSNKQLAYFEFEDLFRQLNFKHILLSYSNQSIVPIDELVKLARKFAKNGIVHVECNEYKEYSTNNSSYKGGSEKLKEYIIYFEKNYEINKSPLNYSGSKDVILSKIIKELPKHVSVFVDAMGGAFNVGANIYALDCVEYNEYNKFVYEIVKMLVECDKNEFLKNVEKVVKEFDLKKKEKNNYLKLRNFYNDNQSPLLLYVLQIYSFQNVLRFNSSHKFNTPVGNNEYNQGTIDRIKSFVIKSPNYKLMNGDYKNLDILSYPQGTVFYFDPPYFITTAEYNDGKRGMNGWNADSESELLSFLDSIDQLGYKFMLSNVIEHKGRLNHLLMEAINTHNYNVIEIGRTGIKFPRIEVLIKNF